MTDHAEHIAAAHRAERWVKDRGEYLTPAEGVSPLPPGGADTRVVYSYADYFAVALVSFKEALAAGVRERQQLRDAAQSVEKTIDDYLHLGISPSREMWYAERDALRAVLAGEGDATPEAAESWWLIERGQAVGHTPTVWWIAGPNRSRYGEDWTTDAYKATRFSEAEAKEIVASEFLPSRIGEQPTASATEHGFIRGAAG